MDRHDLYELCVQRPALAVPFLRAIHGGTPRVLAEDFCGTAAVSREWVRTDPAVRAVGIDLDSEVLAWVRGRMAPEERTRVGLVEGDALAPPEGAVAGPFDVVFVGNFSIGEIHSRSDLVGYLRRARQRLSPGGVFVCDTYGGASAWRTGSSRRSHQLGAGGRVLYTWEQREVDPLTGMVRCVLHFDVERGGEIVERLPEAFSYCWRLWSVPELRDAMRDAGLRAVSVHADLESGISLENAGKQADPEGFIVCVAGRAEGAS